MLNLKEKIEIFTNFLGQEEISYADSFNGDINIAGENYNYSFLERLNSEKDIKYWIDKLKSRIVMREDESVLEDIIDDYILCG